MTRTLDVLAIEPYYSGSHKLWLDYCRQESGHTINLLTLPGRHWKWRMHGGSITLAYHKTRCNPGLFRTFYCVNHNPPQRMQK